MFITNDRPNVAGLILAGSADFKTELSQSDMFDARLQAAVLGVVDVSYGGDNGFNQAIELSADMLANVKFVQVRTGYPGFAAGSTCSHMRSCFATHNDLRSEQFANVAVSARMAQLDTALS